MLQQAYNKAMSRGLSSHYPTPVELIGNKLLELKGIEQFFAE